ncbi:unnamed protein product [Meganyctiphanes norvegica]|uniref:Uncharacterized protein n=1 Tax=Meganyctiphanes norvegica TaxID=48144 RepID=A0AAV2PMV2_MEGNR
MNYQTKTSTGPHGSTGCRVQKSYGSSVDARILKSFSTDAPSHSLHRDDDTLPFMVGMGSFFRGQMECGDQRFTLLQHSEGQHCECSLRQHDSPLLSDMTGLSAVDLPPGYIYIYIYIYIDIVFFQSQDRAGIPPHQVLSVMVDQSSREGPISTSFQRFGKDVTLLWLPDFCSKNGNRYFSPEDPPVVLIQNVPMIYCYP